MNFTGFPKLLWLGGLIFIGISAVLSMVSGNSSSFPLVLAGAVLIGLAFLLRKKNGTPPNG